MAKLVIQPFVAKLPNGALNAKQWCYAFNLVGILRYLGHEVVQIGTDNEPDLGASVFRKNLTLKEVNGLLEWCDIWIGMDSFLQHAAHIIGKRGIVIWSKSSPSQWGYPENLNLLRDEKYLRKNQADVWHNEPYDAEAFMPWLEICNIVVREINKLGVKNER
jgi:hypothetical protein